MKTVRLLLLVFALMALTAALGLTVYPHGAIRPSGASLEGPSMEHFLGTDNLGIDIYAQISRGFYHSLLIGLLASAISFVLGGFLGMIAGYRGGGADDAVSFLINAFLCVPQLPAMIVIGAFWGQSLWNVVFVIAAFSWASIAKIMRAKTVSIKSRKYILLAKSFGGMPFYILKTHMARELTPLLTVSALAVTGRAIVQEAAVAYLGLSDPLAKSLGLMINKAAGFPGIYFTEYWKWWLLPPVVTLVSMILCLRLLSKALEHVWLEVS
jgi:peptide/nickel transport system permease protein